MTSYNVSIPNRDGSRGLQHYSVSREGNSISVNGEGRGPRQESFELTFGTDQLDIRGPQQDYRVEFSVDGAIVKDPRFEGRRNGSGIQMELNIPLRPEQYRTTGLSIASSLIGIPLPADLLN